MLSSERVVEPMLEFLKRRTQPKKNNDDTPELSFFKSIIPDFLKLNDKNQRQFKKIVLNIPLISFSTAKKRRMKCQDTIIGHILILYLIYHQISS